MPWNRAIDVGGKIILWKQLALFSKNRLENIWKLVFCGLLIPLQIILESSGHLLSIIDFFGIRRGTGVGGRRGSEEDGDGELSMFIVEPIFPAHCVANDPTPTAIMRA